MKIIKGYYPTYYRDAEMINDAVILWTKILENEEFNFIQKGLEQFVKSDNKGFPPVPGQLITLAKETRKMEYEARKREQDQLPAPQTNTEPMPEELRQKLSSWLKGVET